ncbi:MAG: hypothetical protein A2277_10110 [Desulfobacterales bacterium RIFOXYA12_FULL_46_15]|nr:MAG: hypothetical protein A2277_10110 [Desulfobacterales bacterium RIFOXYA12_FULL_46_15]
MDAAGILPFSIRLAPRWTMRSAPMFLKGCPAASRYAAATALMEIKRAIPAAIPVILTRVRLRYPYSSAGGSLNP